jgi:hypothetical protein
LLKRALLLFAIASLPIGAATVVTRTGTPTGSLNGVTSLAVSWTQAAGTTYSAVSVAVMVHSTNGSAATATAYLTNAIGAGATAGANQLATAAVSVSSTTATSVTISFASAPTLPPGTYYVVLSNLSANFAWDFVGGGAAETVGTGVTSNGDQVDLATPAPVFPPSSATFLPATAGGSSKVLIFSTTGTLSGGGGGGTPPPTGVPTLGAWAIFGTVLLLGGSGLLLLNRRPQE